MIFLIALGIVLVVYAFFSLFKLGGALNDFLHNFDRKR